MNNARIIMHFFSLLTMQQMFAMDQLPISIPKQNITTGSLSLSSSASKSPPSSQSPQSSSWGAWINEGCNTLATNLQSLTQTVTNKLSDEAAFKKLGWPLSDMIADSELKKCLTKYAEFKTIIDNFGYSDELEAFVNRRREYLRRAIVVFPILSDGIEFATHCMTHHEPIMHSFERNRICAFLKQKQSAFILASDVLKTFEKESDVPDQK